MESNDRLTAKNAYGDILRLMLPCLTELILGQLASIVDTAMVGGLGTQAINAVGISGQPIMILLMIFTALNVGTTALISRAKGEGNIYKANQIALLSWIVNAIAGLLMMALGLLFTRPMIDMIGSPNEQTTALAVQYLRTRIYAMPAVAIGTASNSILRGMGNSRTPMLYNLFANGTNVLFNWLLIHGVWIFPEMGVIGAGLATTISTVIGTAISCFLLLRGHSNIKIRLTERLERNTGMLSNLFRIGAPSMAEQIVFRIGHILFTRIVISLGEVDYASHQLCWNLLNIILLCGSAMQMAISPLTGQSLGRKSPERAEAYVKYSIHILLIVMSFFGLICLFFGRYLLLIYSPEPAVLEASIPLMAMFGLYLPTMAFQYVYGGALGGAGDTKFNAPIFVITTIAIRIPVAILFKEVLGWGLIGVNAATAVDCTARWLLFGLRYRAGKWKTLKLK